MNIFKHCFIKSKKPTKIVIMATDTCNSHCRTCNIWTNKPTEKIITPEEIGIALSDPICADIDEVLITGGEPTLREDLYSFVMAIHNALPNASIALSTNGIRAYMMLVVVRHLLESGVSKLSVGTSIDYIGEKHDLIRGTPDNWRKVNILIRGLQRIREDYPTLGIGFGTVLQEENVDNIDEIIKFANSNGLYYLIQWCNQSSFYHNRSIGIERDIVSSLPQDMLTEKWLDKLDGKSIKFTCYALHDFFVVKANGDICPCLTHWDYIVGNIRYTSLSKILKPNHNPPRNEILYNEYMYDLSHDPVKTCNGCLNSWGRNWSDQAGGWPYVKYFARHPLQLWRKLS